MRTPDVKQRFRTILSIGRALMLGMVLSRPIFAQRPAPARVDQVWVGQRVVQTVPKLTLRLNDEPVENNANVLRFYKVEQADGASLLLQPEGEGKGGWVPAIEVIRASEALNFFGQRVRTNPKDAFAFTILGLLSEDRNEHELAIQRYDEAIRLEPRNVASYTGRAKSWSAKNEYERAIADFDAAIVRDPKNTVALTGRGLARLARNRYTQAISDLSEAIWLDPLSTSAYLNRGRAWQKKKEYAKAIVDYNMALRLDSQQAAAFRERGNAWETVRNYAKAISDYNEAIRINPRDARAYTDQARILASCPDRALRDSTHAVASARKACELTGWQDAGALDVLARASAATGDFDSAVNWQTRSNALAGSNSQREEGNARLKHYMEKHPEP